MSTQTRATPHAWADQEHISLCEILDRVLTKGVVVAGEVVISVADIDLIYLGLRLVLTSVESARERGRAPATGRRSEAVHARH
jgi:gas vesicle structural protein